MTAGRGGARTGAWRGSVLALAVMFASTLAVGAAANVPAGAKGGPRATPSPARTAAASELPLPAGVVSGRVAISPITLRLELSQRAARAGQPVQIRVTATNQGSAAVNALRLAVRAPAGIDVRPSGERTITRLAPAGTETVTWIACGREPGTYAIVAMATVPGSIVQSAQRVLEITAGAAC